MSIDPIRRPVPGAFPAETGGAGFRADTGAAGAAAIGDASAHTPAPNALERSRQGLAPQAPRLVQGLDIATESPIVDLLLGAYLELAAAYEDDNNARVENMPSFERALAQWTEPRETGRSVSVTV